MNAASNNAPDKIYVVGVSGSGKTTLGRHLASRLDYIHIDLDKVCVPARNQKVPLPALEHTIHDLLGQSKWIVDGAYLTWTAPLLDAADLIIWMDTGAKRSAFRILRRHVTNRLKGNRRYSTVSTLRLIWAVYRSGRKTAPGSAKNSNFVPWQEEIEEGLKPYMNKVRRITSLKETDNLGF